MFGKSNSGFDRLIEKATSQLLLEPDWDTILQICDWIRQNDVQPRYAVNSLKKKVGNDNPHISMFALQVLESIVKNCGAPVHKEIASKEFMQFMKDQTKNRADPVKAKVLELIQIWSHAFRDEPSYKMVVDTYNIIKMEGYNFPTLKESDAMFNAESAPEWKEGDCCNRCRVQFSTLTRRHHCRACGQIFCAKCSSKSSIIPKFGIEREVRVCDSCYDTLNKPQTGAANKEDALPREYLESPLSKQPQAPAQRSEAEMQEEEELQLALAISQSEAEASEAQKRGSGTASTKRAEETAKPQAPTAAVGTMDTSDMDPELARYLNRNYWEQRSENTSAVVNGNAPVVNVTEPSAPVAQAPEPQNSGNRRQVEQFQNGDAEPDREQFLKAVSESIAILVNRMKSNSQRGRSIANDSSVQTLFMTLNAMQPQLLGRIKQQEDNRAYYESLQDKLAQMRDAREALTSLREEHVARRRQEQEELDRQRKIQMMQKLEVMRQKKQEYLEYQRQLQLQRMQEHEREMAARLEQQKHMQQLRAVGYTLPQNYMQQQFVPQAPDGAPQHQFVPPAGYAPGQPPYAMPPAGGNYAPGYANGPPTTAGQPSMTQMPPVADPSGQFNPVLGQPPSTIDYQSFSTQGVLPAMVPGVPLQDGQQPGYQMTSLPSQMAPASQMAYASQGQMQQHIQQLPAAGAQSQQLPPGGVPQQQLPHTATQQLPPGGPPQQQLPPGGPPHQQVAPGAVPAMAGDYMAAGYALPAAAAPLTAPPMQSPPGVAGPTPEQPSLITFD